MLIPYSFEDFAECFPLYVESDKNGSSATFNSISEYIEAQNFVSSLRGCVLARSHGKFLQRDLDKLFKDYNIQESIDILHKVVNDAKERKARGDAEKDTWKDNLEPKVAVCARTVPVLNSEAGRLRNLISQVPISSFSPEIFPLQPFSLSKKIANLNASCSKKLTQPIPRMSESWKSWITLMR